MVEDTTTTICSGKFLLLRKGTAPSEELAKAIDEAFGSFEAFKTAFSKAAATQFGSGWAWLTVQKGGKVAVLSTVKPRQSADASCRWWYSHLRIGCMGTCLLPKTTKNRRADYIEAFFAIINWEKLANYTTNMHSFYYFLLT